MDLIRPLRLFACAVLVCAFGRPTFAQAFESVGIRAQGMGGAFVAVADDATASWWNPAGLAHGAYFSSVLEWDMSRQPAADRDAVGRPVAASRRSVRGFATAFPALALSYYRLRLSEIRPLDPTVTTAAGRQDPGAGEVRLRLLTFGQFSATVGESIGEHLVVASTLKLLRGNVGAATRSGEEASLDRAEELEGEGETRGDLDVGAMMVFGPARLGLTVKNVTTPAFGAGDDRVELRRRVRAGIAVKTAARRRVGEVTFDVDLDLRRTTTVNGEERRVAAGIEAWVPGRHFGVRGGVSRNTVGEEQMSASGGVSAMLRSGMFLDAQRTVGPEAARQSWGLGLRMTF